MIQAMYSGIAGLKAFKQSLDVIGNNIANVNTVAYKAGRVTFKEALSQTMSGASGPSAGRGGTNPVQVGLGVVVGSVDTNITGGSPQATGRQTDLTIEGSGYFALSDGAKRAYSRDGAFVLDQQNNLVAGSTGMKVLGWQADQITGAIDTSQPITANSGITIPIGQLSTARQTSRVDFGGNLSATETVGQGVSPEAQIYDSLGNVHKVYLNLTKGAVDAATGESVWSYTVTSPDVTGNIATGSIHFDKASGYSKTPSIPISMTFTNANGSVQPLTFTMNTSGISQMNGKYSVDMRSQDGLALGTLDSYTISRDGVISGTFTNGSTRPLAQIAVVQFTNPAGLTKDGNNMLSESPNSGSAQIATAGSGGRGLISSGFLEASNVDLAQEFSNMIIAQRGFQANSRIITTSDEVLQDLVQMKR